MPVKQWGYAPTYVGVNHPSEFPRAAVRSDRRTRLRARVHWPVIFVRVGGEDAVESITENLTSEGFYCLSSTPFLEGERLVCCLKVPAHDPIGREQVLWLECRVCVVRVDPPNAEGICGIACRIEDYRFTYSTAFAHA